MKKNKSIQKITIQIYQLLIFSGVNANTPAINVRFQLLQEKEFNGQEYLGLYPYLEYASFAGVDAGCDFYMCNQNRTEFIKLRDWIKGSTKYYKGILV